MNKETEVNQKSEELLENSGSDLDCLLDETVLRTYDKTHKFVGDRRDRATKVKVDGFVDHAKFDQWKTALKRSVIRRKSRKRPPEPESIQLTENNSIRSLDQEDVMDQTRDLFRLTES